MPGMELSKCFGGLEVGIVSINRLCLFRPVRPSWDLLEAGSLVQLVPSSNLQSCSAEVWRAADV